MINLISEAIARLTSLVRGLQLNQLFAVVLAAVVLLTTNVNPGKNDQALPANLRARINQNDSDRPKTTGQWNKEARETEDNLGERVKRIGKESSEAFQEFGTGYVKGTEKTADQVKDAADRAAQDLTN